MMTKKEHIILLPVILLTVLVASGCFKIVSWSLLLPLAVFVCIRISGSKAGFKMNYLDISFLAICLAEMVALICSNYIPKSIDAFVHFTGVLVLWFYMRFFITERSQIWSLVKILMLVSLILSMITLFTFLRHRASFIGMGYSDLTAVRQYYKPFGVITNDWTAILICLLPAPLAVLFITGNKIIKALGYISFIAVDVAILVSFSRGGYLSLFCFFLTALCAVLLFHRNRFVKYACVTLCSLAISFCFLIPDRESVITTVAMNKTTVQNRSTEARLSKWQEAVELFKSKPYTGYGSGSYQQASALYGNKEYDALSFRSTNSYLQILAEKGLLGGVCYLCGIVAVIIAAIVSARKSIVTIPFISAFAAILVHEFFFSSIFENKCLPLLTVVVLYLSVFHVFKYEKNK